MADAGLSLDTVVRTRIMLTDVSQWEAAARAHGEFFAASIRPATTFVEVKGFINREWLVEVEVDCVEEARRAGGITRIAPYVSVFLCDSINRLRRGRIELICYQIP